MRLVRDNQRARDIVFDITGAHPPERMSGFLVVDTSDNIKGVVVLSNYTKGANVDMSGIGQGCWTVPIIRELARICFEFFDCRRVSAKTRKDNRPARKALRSMGFREEGKLREFYEDGCPAIQYGLLRREQRLVRL